MKFNIVVKFDMADTVTIKGRKEHQLPKPVLFPSDTPQTMANQTLRDDYLRSISDIPKLEQRLEELTGLRFHIESVE